MTIAFSIESFLIALKDTHFLRNTELKAILFYLRNLKNKEDTPLQTLDEMEKNLVKKAIEQCDGNLSQAAAQLGITRQTLYNKMKRHGI